MKNRKNQKLLVRLLLMVGGCVLAVVVVMILLHFRSMEEQNQNLRGRWIRPDGGYIIHILDVGDDGQIEAGYYNPRPIHIEEARVTRKEKKPHIFIELRDVGYPGATYNLFYDSQNDVLVGVYYQPAVNESFEVVFTRME